jgi:uncharacterized protein
MGFACGAPTFRVRGQPSDDTHMKLHLETGAGRNLIHSYRAGTVVINQQVFARSLLVTPQSIVEWAPQRFADLAPAHFEAIALLQPEVVVLGTGLRLRFPSPIDTRALAEVGVGLETMDTGAACRTYNILMGEGRRVLAALLMIEE